MNRTLVSLSLSHSLSQSNVFGLMHARQSFTMRKSQLSNFAFTFSKFNHFNGPVSFSKTKFKNFLQTPLTFNAATYHGQVITRSIIFAESTDLSACLFQNCSTDTDGGAISVLDDNINLHISKSSFYNCRAPYGHGGAISFQSDSLYMKNVCFLKCDSEYSGPGVDATSFTDKSLFFEGSSIDSCPDGLVPDESSQGPINFFQGDHRVVESNFTNNEVSDIASGFHTDDSLSCILTFSNFAHNRGKICLDIEDVRHNDDISYINFVNNTSPVPAYALIEATNNTILREGVFKENSRLLVQSATSINFIFRSCTFDGPYSTTNVTAQVLVSFEDCASKSNPKTEKFSPFDQRYCWMIDPPTLSAGPGTYWFFLVFFVFAGFVSYTTFLSYKRLTQKGEPMIGNADQPKYDTI